MSVDSSDVDEDQDGSTWRTGRITVEDNFDISKDCNAKILEYKPAEYLKCQCFMYVDWGTAYWSTGGRDINLIHVIFSICDYRHIFMVF